MEKIHTIISGGKAYPLHDVIAAAEIDKIEEVNNTQEANIKTNTDSIEAEKQRAEKNEKELSEKIENFPLASVENNGLMSKEDKQSLSSILTRLKVLEEKVEELIANSKKDVSALLEEAVLSLQGGGVELDGDTLVLSGDEVSLDNDVLVFN